MATYAAVASLLQTLDYLLQFQRFILEVKIIQVQVLRPKLDELLLLLTADQPSTVSSTLRLLRLIEEIDSSLACGLGDSIETVNGGSYAADFLIAIVRRIPSITSSFTRSTAPQFQQGEQIVAIPKFVEAAETVAYVKYFEEKLRIFLHNSDQDIHVNPDLKGLGAWCTRMIPKLKGLLAVFTRVTTDLTSESTIGLFWSAYRISTTLNLSLADSDFPLLPIEFMIQKLCTKCQRLGDTINSFVEATAEITDLHQNLLLLLNLLKEDPSNHKCCHDHELLKQVKDAANRVRDLVEEHMVDSQISSAMKYTFWSLTGVLAQLPHFGGKLFPKHLQRSVEGIFNGKNGIGQCLKQVSKEIQLIKESTRRINEETPSLQTSISSISLGHSNREDTVVGLDCKLTSLLEDLMGIPSGLEIVTILGMGGIGKTTLARKAFHHSYTAYHFYCRAWITVSQVYQVRDVLLGLLGSLAPSTNDMVEKNDAQLAELLYRSVKGKRYLIVMDDMWDIDAWNDIKRCFPDDKNGSRIVVTSRVTKLAVYINPNKPPHCMNHLDTEQSWQLLHKLVFGKENCPPELVKIGKHRAKRCQGLPLAIVVIAGVLSRIIRTYDYWNDIAEKVSSFVTANPEKCLDILALSYNYLPHHLKACFLYMAAFPEDCEIQVQKLINLWVSEGFLDPQSSKDLEQIAEE